MPKFDEYAPYQIKSRDGLAWLENLSNGIRYFEGKDTTKYREFLSKMRDKHNTNYGLSRMGV